MSETGFPKLCSAGGFVAVTYLKDLVRGQQTVVSLLGSFNDKLGYAEQNCTLRMPIL